jgi:predicted methyltransferase
VKALAVAATVKEPWIAVSHAALVEIPTVMEVPMYNQSKLSELIRFARVDAGSTVIDVYPGDGDWTRLFSDVVGPEGRVYSFVPAEVAHFKNDPVGRMQTLAKEPARENVEAVTADLVAIPKVTQPADVLWLHLFYHDLHTELIQARGATGPVQSSCLRAVEARWVLRHRRSRRSRRGGHERRPVAASD